MLCLALGFRKEQKRIGKGNQTERNSNSHVFFSLHILVWKENNCKIKLKIKINKRN